MYISGIGRTKRDDLDERLLFKWSDCCTPKMQSSEKDEKEKTTEHSYDNSAFEDFNTCKL